jgi:predicted Zn-dependent peptidase
LAELKQVARRVVRPENVHIVCVGKPKKSVERAATKAFERWAARK